MDIEAIQRALCSHYAARRLTALTETQLEEQAQELALFLGQVDERGRARLLSDLGEGLIDGAELKARCEANAPGGRRREDQGMK